ncbi:phenylacetic acid degradation operon negative regulatory protein PaaX [Noviherbaspirillum sp. ST9]|uniref:phenylacetic acid degradation operon negative regulatory protein PaaX n=1 Tax=Noviherbaspirillum sp. ST9 TaxID=3401606 RepID=UPI003B58884D
MTKKSSTLKKWIDAYLASDPPRAKSLVMTLFGDVITPHGGKVWLGSLIDLLAPFGINDRLVRTSVFRLAEEGWLDAQREGRRSQYALNPKSAPRFERAYERIYAPSFQSWDGKWTLLMANSASLTTEQRSSLRRELVWQGYAMVAPMVFAHPGRDDEPLNEILHRVGVTGDVYVCRAQDAGLPSGRPTDAMVNEYWDLAPAIADYAHFIARFSPLTDLLAGRGGIEPEQAFAIRILVTHAFRRVTLHDPQLPLVLLPKDWPGKTAYELCCAVYKATCVLAEQYIDDTLKREDDVAPSAASYFYQRFGGLPRGCQKSSETETTCLEGLEK